MSTQVTVNNTDTAGTPPVALHQVEARENRIQRLSTGVLLTVIGLLLVWALFKTSGNASIALSDAFDAVQLPTIILPGSVTVAVCAFLVLAAAAGGTGARLRGERQVVQTGGRHAAGAAGISARAR